MTLEVRSFERAIVAARFFGSILGSRVVTRRARVLNRYFDATELVGGLEQLDRYLDRNVTVIDPCMTEQWIEEYLAGAKTPEEARSALERYHEDRRRERRDVPLVEDFPLAPGDARRHVPEEDLLDLGQGPAEEAGPPGHPLREAIHGRALKNNFSAKMFKLAPVMKAAPPGTRGWVTSSDPEALRTAFLRLGHGVE